MKLSLEQINTIRARVDESEIELQGLKEDILDHLCCAVEMMISKGIDFDLALKESLHELAPDGLDEIQYETTFLLNSTKIILMKKLMYSIGLISSIAVSIGILAKLMHLPGADEMVTTGLIVFGCVFIPMFAIDRFKMKIQKMLSERLRLIFGVVSSLVISLGVTFKILHLFGADELLIAGFFLLSFGFLPFQFFTMYKKSIS